MGTVVVDDDPAVRTLYEVALSLRGHRVEVAERVSQGLAACERLVPDVAIIDIFIPERSGLDLIRMLRERRAPVRIIAVTGGGSWENFDVLVEAKDAGADVTLRMPVPSGVLIDAVEGLLLE